MRLTSEVVQNLQQLYYAVCVGLISLQSRGLKIFEVEAKLSVTLKAGGEYTTEVVPLTMLSYSIWNLHGVGFL